MYSQVDAPEAQCEHLDSSPAAFLSLHVSVPNGLILYFDFEDVAGEIFHYSSNLAIDRFLATSVPRPCRGQLSLRDRAFLYTNKSLST